MSGELTSMIDLNDRDILTIEKVAQRLNQKQRQHMDIDAFVREVEGRFADVGFKVGVQVWTTDQAGLFAFDIEIQDRLEGEFDHERMQHEVQNDLLGINGGKSLLKPKNTQMKGQQTPSGLWVP